LSPRICVTGVWHQGSVLSACLADLGHDVYAVADEATSNKLAAAEPPVYEPGLSEILERNLRNGRLRISTALEEALPGAEFAFISADTPVDQKDEPDLRPIYELAHDIGSNASSDLVLCVTAQVPVGTTAALRTTVQDAMAAGLACEAAYVPEFLRLGTAVATFVHADRFVVGADSRELAARIAALYEPLGRPLVVTDVVTAEMAKHAANTFLATSISFINEISDLCEPFGIDPAEVGRILKLDRRIGPHAFLSPGLGYAGGTLGRELRVLQRLGRERAVGTKLIDAVMAVNNARPQLVRRRLVAALGDLSSRRIALFGLTYKAGTSTLRRAISVEIADDLVSAGAEVTAFDPLVNSDDVDQLPFALASSAYDAAAGASAVVVVTGWPQIEELDLDRLRSLMADDVFLDTRSVWSARRLQEAGFRHLKV